jgi:antitoxin (DNA-binding transcriptional repressor) of toxin-antitoxin stability system
MHTVSLFNAKTHLSSIVADLLSGKEDCVIISRHGKPVACVTPLHRSDTSKRIGLARGRFVIPDDIDGANATVASLFGAQEHGI